MPRKLTYFTTGLARAGAETQVVLLCQSFVKAGWDVSVISLLKPLAYEPELAAMGVPVISLDLSKRFPNPLAFVRLVKALRELQPDVVHCHQVHANLVGRIARLFARIPVLICTAHCLNEGPRWRELAYALTDSLCDLTTQVCQAGVERYIEVGAAPAGKICYVPNGIETTRYIFTSAARSAMRKRLGIPLDAFAWLAVGNLREAKDYPNMLECFRMVKEREPRAELYIAGTGPLADSLSAEAAAKGLDGVHFLGIRTDIPDLLSAADGFLMSSMREGTPLALLEAAASSLPVVATDVGGNADVIDHGKSGFVVPARDPARLAHACLEVMQAALERRNQWGAAGRKIVEEAYSLESSAEQWQQLYTQIWRQAQDRGLARGAV